MDILAERRNRLYGKDRTVEANHIKNNLTRSVVLQDGDYNLTQGNLNKGVWNTSTDTDYTGRILAPQSQSLPKTQLEHHFQLTSGEPTDISNYQTSLSHKDFDKKDGSGKAVSCEVDRTVNWPDMAPQYMEQKHLGNSEYSNQFMSTDGSLEHPIYPKVNTCKMQLPLDPEIFHKQRNTSIVLGTDKNNKLSSEHQGAFHENLLKSRIRPAVPENNLSAEKNNSHVFRAGDYDNISGDFKTVNMTDYGPRTLAPGELVTLKYQQQQDPTLATTELEENVLTKYAHQHTLPQVHEEAKGSKNDQESAHFQFGADDRITESLYSKDYLLAAQKPRHRPTFYKTPSAGKVIQNDPVFSKFGHTQNSVDFNRKPVEERMQWNGKTEAVNNMEKRDGKNITFTSAENQRSTPDRQISLAHGDFQRPPPTFRAMKPQRAPLVQFDFLRGNDALPYSNKDFNDSEAKTTFNGTLMTGVDALQRLKSKEFHIRKGVDLNRDTHFTIGSTEQKPDHITENMAMYSSRQPVGQALRTAGVTETIPERKFSHLNVSQNTQDYVVNDPYVRNTKEPLRARNLYRSDVMGDAQLPFETSVMRADYVPLNTRRFTEDQTRRNEQVNKIFAEPLEKSHLFHTVPRRSNTMLSTSMADYVKPERMNGPTLLDAR